MNRGFKCISIFLALSITVVLILFRGFIEFGADYIFGAPIKILEKNFKICNLDEQNIIGYKVIGHGLEGFSVTALLEIREEQFNSVFQHYQNIERNTQYSNMVMLSQSGISENEFEFYIWYPQVVRLGMVKTQKDIYIVKSKSNNEYCKVYLNVSKIGWIVK